MSIYNRAEIVHRNFLRRVGEKNFPDPRTGTDWPNSGLDKADVIELLESQFVCRHLDLAARKLKARNHGFYSIGSAGHEGNAVFGRIFRKSDMAFLHYRSGAFMAERARKSQGIDIIRDTLLSLVASSDDPIAGGRHKVWGSLPLMVPPQTSTIASHLPKAVGVALSIAKANDMKLQSSLPRDSVVLCSFGDASINHSTALGAVNAAMWTAHQYQRIERRVEEESERAVVRPKLETAAQVRSALIACRNRRTIPAIPIGEQRRRAFAADFDKLSKPQHMAKLINWGLRDVLLRYDSAVLFGEDVAQKGGVYNVTDGLYKTFGARRVFNSPLDEQSILGTAIGLAHNGFLPIPEIQFLAYIHNAEDQIRGEAATLAFFSQGQFTNPMVIRIAGLGYQKGFGGHFHNDNSLAVFRDIPGLIIAIPSNGADAVRMFRTCMRQAYENGRVCVFIEPIALYMTKDLHDTGDRGWTRTYPAPNEEAPLGTVRRHGSGHDAVILTYGNGLYYSMQAQKELGENHGVQTSVVDLMWMAPVNRSDLMAQIVDAKNILIVDECRRTGSWSEGLVAMIVDKADPLPSIRVVAADDCFIPLGMAAAAGLPGKQDIVSAVLNMI